MSFRYFINFLLRNTIQSAKSLPAKANLVKGAKTMKLKIREELLNLEKISYASDHIELPENGIDCFEGCNPYGCPEDVVREAVNSFDFVRRVGPYPHSKAVYDGLKEYWKGHLNLEPENLMITDGSMPAMYSVNNIFSKKGARVLGIEPQFTDFAMNCQLMGMKYDPVYMTKESGYRIVIDQLVEKIADDVSFVYINNPNNPTGQVISSSDIERLLNKANTHGVAVVVDEAYGDFMMNENTSAKFLEKFDNLIMMRTLSKAFGLAGMRIGYVIASKPIIACMEKLTNPYQVNEFSRELAGLALKNSDQIWENAADFAKQKREIRSLIGHDLHMAVTCDTVSICLLYHKNKDADLKKLLFDNGVLCTSGECFLSLDKSYVRLRLPTMENFPALLEAIRKIDCPEGKVKAAK